MLIDRFVDANETADYFEIPLSKVYWLSGNLQKVAVVENGYAKCRWLLSDFLEALRYADHN